MIYEQCDYCKTIYPSSKVNVTYGEGKITTHYVKKDKMIQFSVGGNQDLCFTCFYRLTETGRIVKV